MTEVVLQLIRNVFFFSSNFGPDRLEPSTIFLDFSSHDVDIRGMKVSSTPHNARIMNEAWKISL